MAADNTYVLERLAGAYGTVRMPASLGYGIAPRSRSIAAFYPMVDDRTTVRKDLHPHVGEFVWTQENKSLEPCWGAGRVPHVSAGVSRLLSGNECPRDQASRARQSRSAATLPARIAQCTDRRRRSIYIASWILYPVVCVITCRADAIVSSAAYAPASPLESPSAAQVARRGIPIRRPRQARCDSAARARCVPRRARAAC
jgi:hypothetical protein